MKFETVKVGEPEVSRNPIPTPAEVKGETVTNAGTGALEQAAKNALVDMLLAGMDQQVAAKLDKLVEDRAFPILEEINEKIELVEQHRIIHIHIDNKIHREFTQTVHTKFPLLLKAMAARLPLFIVGPAGTGKTHACEQAAKALDLSFHALSVGIQTSKSDIGGYMNANGNYVRTQFREAYEHGGVFLMDEIDAGNSNVLIFINAALSGDFCAFPDGMIRKHENFYFVATGNTYGSGANRQYVGRNQLDAATLDRFVVVDWPVDEDLERMMVINTTHGAAWHSVIKAVREHVNEAAWRIVVSPRATLKGTALFSNGWLFSDVLHATLLAAVTEDQRVALEEVADKAWKRNRHLIKEAIVKTDDDPFT